MGKSVSTFQRLRELANRTLDDNSRQFTLSQLNAYLQLHGITDRLVRGRGYFYFDGDALSWKTSSVMVNRLNALTPRQWLEEYTNLRSDG